MQLRCWELVGPGSPQEVHSHPLHFDALLHLCWNTHACRKQQSHMAEGFIRAFSGEEYPTGQLLPLLYRPETDAGRYGSNPAPSQIVVTVKIAPSSTVKKFVSLNLDSGGSLRGQQPYCCRAHPWIRAGGRRGGEQMKDRFSFFPAHDNMPTCSVSGVCLAKGLITCKGLWPLVTSPLPKAVWVPGWVVNDPHGSDEGVQGPEHTCEIFGGSQISLSGPGLSQDHLSQNTKSICEKTSKRELVFSDALKVLMVPWLLLFNWTELSLLLCIPACLCPPLGLGTCTDPLRMGTRSFSIQHPTWEDPCPWPNTLEKITLTSAAEWSWQEFYFRSLNIMLPTTLRMQKTILWIYLLLLLKKSFYTLYSPLKQMVSSNKIFYWSSKTTHKVRTISVLFTPAWVMICLLHTTFSVFPIDANQKPLLSFCWFCGSLTHYTRIHLFFFIRVYLIVTKEPILEWKIWHSL